MKGLYRVHALHLVVQFSWTSYEMNMRFILTILKHGRWAILRRKWAWITLIIVGLQQLKEGMHKRMTCFYSPNKTFDQSESHGKWVECLCDPPDGDNSTLGHLHKFSCWNVQTTIGQPRAFGVRKLSHIFDHIHAKNSNKIIECPNVTINAWCEHKGRFYTNIKDYFTFTKINIAIVHAKFAREWQSLIGVNTLTQAPNTTKMWLLPHFGSFFPHSNHLQITRLMCLWIDIHVGLMFMTILIMNDKWVRQG